jgi:hypothetical protein
MSERPVEVRSYRRVFRTEWRLTRVMGFDLTKWVPGGVPVKPCLYGLAALAAMWVLSHLPVLGAMVGAFPGWLRYGTVPLGVALVSMRPTPDEQSTMDYAVAITRLALRPRRPGWVPVRGTLVVRWDDSSSRLVPGRVHGVARVCFNQPVTLIDRRRALIARPGPATDAEHVVLAAGAVLEVRR